MLDMVNDTESQCPFEFNFDPVTFKVGDLVSYRVPESFQDMPFVGVLVGVQDDHVMLIHQGDEKHVMRGSRESRPIVSAKEALGD